MKWVFNFLPTLLFKSKMINYYQKKFYNKYQKYFKSNLYGNYNYIPLIIVITLSVNL